MSTKLAKILADFTTSLATALAAGGTSATLQTATDDDGVALVAGTYFFTLDGGNSNKEHIVCTLSSTAITAISSVSRQGVQTSGVVRAHRIGCTVSLTDFAHILYINDLLTGTTNLNASTPLSYDGTASITGANQLATKGYVDATATGTTYYDQNIITGTLSTTVTAGQVLYQIKNGGATAGKWTLANAATSAAGLGRTLGIAQQAGNSTDVIKILIGGLDKTQTGLTAGAPYYLSDTNGAIATTPGTVEIFLGYADLTTTQLVFKSSSNDQTTLTVDGQKDYILATGTGDTITLTYGVPITAVKTGMRLRFKASASNTTAVTINPNGLGALALKKLDGVTALAANDIISGQIIDIVYNGTAWQMMNPTGTPQIPDQTSNSGKILTTNGTVTSWGYAPQLVKSYTAGETITAGQALCWGTYNTTDILVDSPGTTTGSFGTTGTSQNISVTIANNSNRVLVLMVSAVDSGAIGSGANTTLNSVAMTLLQTQANEIGIYHMIAPSTGAQTLTLAGLTNAKQYRYAIYSLYNASQGAADASSKARATTATTVTGNLTPATNGSMILGFGMENTTGITSTFTILTQNTQSPAAELRAGTLYPCQALTTGAGAAPVYTTNSASTVNIGMVAVAPANAASMAVMKASSLANDNRVQSFIGFAKTSAAAGASVDVILNGEVTGLSALTPGSQYYLADTQGAIGSTAGTVSRKVAIATSTTTAVITNVW